LETKESDSEIITEVMDDGNNLMMQNLFQPLTNDILGAPGTYFIRCFASISANNEIDSDSRVNGIDWPHGNDYLNNYIRNISTQNQLYFLKQSLLLVSKPIEEIKSESILEKLDNAMANNNINAKKKWWKFWSN